MRQMKTDDLLDCPFCGHRPDIEKWHGGPQSKRRIFCWNERCAVGPGVTGDTRKKAVARWNTRGGREGA